MSKFIRYKRILGTFINDWPRYALCITRSGRWLKMRNRNDVLLANPAGVGVACDWEYTRTLHLCDVFPATGRWLLQQTLRDYPIRLQERPAFVNSQSCCSNHEPVADDAFPNVSFLIGHRGRERLPLLKLVLKSIASQSDIQFEVIVVEQDVEPLIKSELPDWVRYVHDPYEAGMLYNRSRTFNMASANARASVLVLHDNDLLIPQQYCAEICARQNEGFEVVNLKRFIFYVSKMTAMCEAVDSQAWSKIQVESVRQNAEGGGSIAISKSSFDAIGGMDEDFVGWGGEDNEFWDRCLTRKVWEYACLPIVHLWHAAQPGKGSFEEQENSAINLARDRRKIPPLERIKRLKAR